MTDANGKLRIDYETNISYASHGAANSASRKQHNGKITSENVLFGRCHHLRYYFFLFFYLFRFIHSQLAFDFQVNEMICDAQF